MSGHYTSKLYGVILWDIANTLHVLLAAGALAATAALADAQPATGTITGVVTSESGGRLAGVTVSAQNLATTRTETGVSDTDGRYAIVDLPVAGAYRVSAAVGAFESEAADAVQLVPNGTQVVDFHLNLALKESIAVTAATPLIERRPSAVQQWVGDEMTHALPLAGRNFIPLAMLAAGFTGNPNYPNPQGQPYWANNVIVDGASHFSKWRSAARTFYSGYGLESIRDVRVLANRFSAEYGESLATVTIAVTRSGTDQVHGAALVFGQNDKLDAVPEFAVTHPPAASARYGFTLGGPLVKSRTHFFESYEGRRARNHNVIVSSNGAVNGTFVRDDEDEHLAFLRVDHRVGASHMLSARYNGQFFRWHNEPGGLSLPGTGTHYRNDVHTALFTDRRIRSDRLHNEALGQFARYTDVRTDLDPSVFVSRAGDAQQGGALGPYGYGADPEDTWEASDTLSIWAAAHTLRVGGALKHVGARNVFLNYGRGAYFFAGAPASFPQPSLFIQSLPIAAANTQADPRALALSAFVQDDWRVGRAVTLNLGLRYDVERVANVRHYDVPADRDNLQPRVGVAWQPRPAGRLLLRGGVGWYTQQQLLLYINRVQLEGVDGAATIALTPDSPLFPQFPNALGGLPAVLPPRDVHQVSADFHNPSSLQATAGIERVFGPMIVSADYVRLDGRDLLSLVDANAPASNVKPAQRSVAQADATRPLPPQPGGVRNLFTLGNQGRSWYRALQIKAERSTGRLRTLAAYTLADAQDLANYQIPEDSRTLDAEKARANTDVRHNLSVGLTWQAPGARPLLRGWSVSTLAAMRSNRPYTITWGDDRNGTTQNDARPGARNTGTTGPYRNVDVALLRRFACRATVIEARGEAFNVLNATNYDQYVGSLQTPLYSRPVSAFPKRRIQLAAVVRF